MKNTKEDKKKYIRRKIVEGRRSTIRETRRWRGNEKAKRKRNNEKEKGKRTKIRKKYRTRTNNKIIANEETGKQEQIVGKRTQVEKWK